MIYIATALTALGLILELVGVLLLSCQFLHMQLIDALWCVLTACFVKKSREYMTGTAENAGDRSVENARGLSFVFLGILLQVAGFSIDSAIRIELHTSVANQVDASHPATVRGNLD